MVYDLYHVARACRACAQDVARSACSAVRLWPGHGRARSRCGTGGLELLDWVPEWTAGWPPSGRFGYSAILNLQYVYAMDRAIYLFRHLAQDDLARHWSSVRRRIAEGVVRNYWVAGSGLMADDLERSRFSEHAQCLALLCNLLQGADRNSSFRGYCTRRRLPGRRSTLATISLRRYTMPGRWRNRTRGWPFGAHSLRWGSRRAGAA